MAPPDGPHYEAWRCLRNQGRFNDGTGDFLNRRPGSAISIGLLHNATPVLGVVYAPVTPSGPDCIAWAEGAPALLRNGRPVNNDLQSAILAPGTAVMV
ncbi:hypothetical protein EGI97_21945, partial [Stutzerimonas xanthomarina]